MNRPPLEVADLIRSAGTAFLERNRQWLRWKHIKVLLAIARCRTAGLGGHIYQCTRCGHRAISLTTPAETGTARSVRPLPATVGSPRVQRTPPDALRSRGLHASGATGTLGAAEQETHLWPAASCQCGNSSRVARDPRHLGAEIGFFSVLHTWSQKLTLHPHVHCVIPAGGLSLDHTHWVKSQNRFFLPLMVLRRESFAASSPRLSNKLFRMANLAFMETCRSLPSRKLSLHGGDCCSARIGWSTPNAPSAAPIRAAISGPLHPSRGHLQSSPRLLY